MRIAITVISISLMILRLMGYKSEAFQALAHLFVGYLFAFWLVGRERLYLYLFVALCVVETFAFLWGLYNHGNFEISIIR